MFHNSDLEDRLTWAVGVFKDTDNVGNRISDGKYNVTARLTGVPWYEDKGRKLLHLGAAYSHRKPNDEIEGGELDDITVGLNWYLNPNTPFMFNYVHADLDEVGASDTFQTRAEVDFLGRKSLVPAKF